jgi:hypothetical protein
VEPPEYLAEHVQDALAEQLSELGIQVTISAEKAFIAGDVATSARRDEIGRLAAELMPDHDVHNHVTVVERSGFGGEEMVS